MGRSAVPVRRCVGCRGSAAKTDLVRLVVEPGSSGGTVVVDPGQVRPGRGAYVHPDPRCLDRAVSRRALGRALRTSAQVDVDRLARDLVGVRLGEPSARD